MLEGGVSYEYDVRSNIRGKVKKKVNNSRDKSWRLRRGDGMLGFHPYFDIRHN